MKKLWKAKKQLIRSKNSLKWTSIHGIDHFLPGHYVFGAKKSPPPFPFTSFIVKKWPFEESWHWSLMARWPSLFHVYEQGMNKNIFHSVVYQNNHIGIILSADNKVVNIKYFSHMWVRFYSHQCLSCCHKPGTKNNITGSSFTTLESTPLKGY